MPVLAWAVPKALLGVRESRGGEGGGRRGLGWDLAGGGNLQTSFLMVVSLLQKA